MTLRFSRCSAVGALVAIAACSAYDSPEAPSGASWESNQVRIVPLLLEVDSDVVPWSELPDRSSEVEGVTPWHNFAATDPLNSAHKVNYGPPKMMLAAVRDHYMDDPVQGILKDGKISFWIVAELYRQGIITRGDRGRVFEEMKSTIAASPEEHAYKINAVVGLIHLGFDEEADELISAYQSESWFTDSWDASFYAGSLYYRYHRFEESIPLLRAALDAHPDAFSRIWLAMALYGEGSAASQKEAEKIFSFGDHVGGGAPGELPLRDISEELGIRRSGLVGALSFLDVNNDGWMDLVNQSAYGVTELRIFEPGTGFVDTPDPVLETSHNTPPGSLAADFDNDGWTDLYMTQAAWFSAGPNRMFRNLEGEGWEDVSMKGEQSLVSQNSCGVSTLDYDRDGLLDIAVTGTAGGTLRLLRNKGDFVFEDVSDSVGLLSIHATAVGLAVGDVNNDGWDDIFVNSFEPPYGGVPGSDSTHLNQLYLNQEGARFSEEGESRGVTGDTPMGFGSWMFDYDNDGDMDILASNFGQDEQKIIKGLMAEFPHEKDYVASALYKNDGSGHFVNVADIAGFVPTSIMGAHYLDLELDGDLDIVLGSGSHPLHTMQPVFFYRNDGEDRFTNITPMSDPDFYGKFHGMAFADYDHDGDPDFYLNNGGVLLSDRFRDLFLENTTEGQHWLHIRLIGTESNREGVGARVEVQVGDRSLHQQRTAGQGFSSTSTPYLIFGLAEDEATGPVTIRWPSGKVQTLPPLAADQAIEVTEGSDELRRVY
jgi:hypothetical protein